MSTGGGTQSRSLSPSAGSDASYEQIGGDRPLGPGWGSNSDDGPDSDLGPLDAFSEMDSGEEWRPSEGSDTDEEAQGVGGPSRQNTSIPERQQQKQRGPEAVNNIAERGGARGLSAAQRRRLALDALGSDAWKNSSQAKRQRAPTAVTADDEHEVEEVELGRLVAGLGLPSAPRIGADHANDHAEAADGAALQSEMLAASGFKSQRKKVSDWQRSVDTLKKRQYS